MKNYSNKWILQRITAFFLIPLTFWFVYHCLSFTSIKYNEVIFFFHSFFNSFLFLLMMFVMLIHTKIGCENIIEDYIKSKRLKTLNLFILNFLVHLSLILVVIAIIRIQFL